MSSCTGIEMVEWNGFDGGMSIWSMARVRTCTYTIKTQMTRPYTQTESQCTTFNTTLEFRCLCWTWLLPCTLGTVSIKLMTSSYICMTYLVSFQFIDVNLICSSIRSVSILTKDQLILTFRLWRTSTKVMVVVVVLLVVMAVVVAVVRVVEVVAPVAAAVGGNGSGCGNSRSKLLNA